MKRSIYPVFFLVTLVVICVLSHADSEEKNEWDFSSDEGRASFFASILNEDPDLVSRNLTFRRDPWEVLPQIEAALEALPQPPPKLGMRSGTVIESVPSSVSLSYSEEALAEIKRTLETDSTEVGDLSKLKSLREEIAQRTGDLRTLRAFVRLIPVLYDSNGELVDGTAGKRGPALKKRIAGLERRDVDNLYRDLFPNHQMHVIKDALAKRDNETLRQTILFDLENIPNLKNLKSLPAEVKSRKDDPKTLKSFLRAAPVLYDEHGSPAGDAEKRLNHAQKQLEGLTVATWESQIGTLTNSLPGISAALQGAREKSPLGQALQTNLVGFARKIGSDEIWSGMQKGLAKDIALLGALDGLKTLAEDAKAHATDPQRWRAFLRLAPLVYDESGKPLGKGASRARDLQLRIETLKRGEAETLYQRFFPTHSVKPFESAIETQKSDAEKEVASPAPGESGSQLSNAIRDLPTIRQAVQSTQNYIDRTMVTALTPKRERKDPTKAVTGSGNSIQLQEVPPEVAVFRGCYGGDCSAYSVPHYSLVPGVRTFFIRKSNGESFADQPVGYVLMTEMKSEGKTVPYIITVNGKVSTAVATEILHMLAAEYRTGEIMLPDFAFGKNSTLVNTDEIRAAYNSLPVKSTATKTMNDGWNAIDELIGSETQKYPNYYRASQVGHVRVVQIPDSIRRENEGVIIQREVPLPYKEQDIQNMPLFERSLLAARIAEDDPKLKEIFGVTDEQTALATRVSNFTIKTPLTGPEMIEAQEVFGLSWKDWAKLPKDLQLATLLSLTPDERAALKGYPGDTLFDRLGRDLIKAIKVDKPDHYLSTMSVVLRIPPALQSEPLAARLNEEYLKAKQVLAAEMAKPAPRAERLRTTLDIIAQKPRTPTENSEIRRLLNRTFILIPDSPDLTALMERIGSDFLDGKSVNAKDAAVRRHLLAEIATRGDYYGNLAAASHYYADPDSAKDADHLEEFILRVNPLFDLKQDAIELRNGNDAFRKEKMVLFKAKRDELLANPFFRTWIEKNWPSTADPADDEFRNGLIAQLDDALLKTDQTAFDRVDQPHFWQMKEIPGLVFPSKNNDIYYYVALQALIDKGARLAPAEFLDEAFQEIVRDETAREKVAAKIRNLIEQGEWDHPFLARSELLNLIIEKQIPSSATAFAKVLLENIEMMPPEATRVCLGAACTNMDTGVEILETIRQALKDGNIEHFLVRDRQSVEIILHPNNQWRDEAVRIYFASPIGAIRYVDLLFSTAEFREDLLKPIVTQSSHFNYPAFKPLKNALLLEDREQYKVAWKALDVKECQKVLRKMGVGSVMEAD